MLAAEMVMVPRSIIPPTVEDLRAYIDRVVASGELRVTEAARKVAALFHDPPRDAQWRPVLKGVSRLAFATLPDPLRELYGVRLTPTTELATRGAFWAIRALRPALPPRYRFIAPYQEWRLRRRGRPVPAALVEARRRMGIGPQRMADGGR